MELKRFVMSALIAMTLSAGFAQSFNARWKKVDDAIAKDLPKTAIAELRSIFKQAEKQGNTGQMLKAAYTAVFMKEDISDDSVATAIKKADSIAAAEKRPLERAMWKLVTANMHANRQKHPDKTEGDKTLALVTDAVKDFSIFDGHKAEEFVPMVITEGDGSKYYGYDLLHVVARTATEIIDRVDITSYSDTQRDSMIFDISHRAICLYRSKGNADAVILTTLDSLEQVREEQSYTGAYSDTLLSSYVVARNLIKQYKSSSCAVEAYIYICEKLERTDCETEALRYSFAKEGAELYARNPRSAALRNVLKTMTEPSYHANYNKTLLYPGEVVKGSVNGKNAKTVDLALYRLPFTAAQMQAQPSPLKNWRADAKNRISVFNKTFTSDKDYWKIKEDFSFSVPLKPGVYYAATNAPKTDDTFYQLVYVSNLRLLLLPLPGNRTRITVVDAKSGKPVAGAKVNEFSRGAQMQKKATYTADQKGEVIVSPTGFSHLYNAETDDDKYMPATGVGRYSLFSTPEKEEGILYSVFTDRGVYRPSQKVHIAGIVYNQNGDEFNTIYDKPIKITIENSNCETIDTISVKTDEFGSFGAETVLPATVLPGRFTINVNGEYNHFFRVEEYKRPTFEVTTDEVTTKYSLGDTVSVTGHAKSYSGNAVQGAKVTYTVERRFFCCWPYFRDNTKITRDTTTTDAEGNFTMRVPLTERKDSHARSKYAAYHYTITATVTSADGETEETSTFVRVGSLAAQIDCDIPAKMDRDNLPDITISLHNATDNEVDAWGKFIIYRDSTVCAEDTFRTNAPIKSDMFRNLPSGKYVMHTMLDGETDTIYNIKREFWIFSLTDSVPADTTEFIRLYTPHKTFDKDGKAIIQFGTALNGVTAFYDVIANGKVVESRQIPLSNELQTLTYTYKDEFGDGMSATLAFMRNGELFWQSVCIEKPKPDKKLRYKWNSFRDRLQPNQKEEWRLQLLEPDGKPAHASAVAAIYDASLDKFAKNAWYYRLSTPRYVHNTNWSTYSRSLTMHYSKPFNYENDKSLSFYSIPLRHPIFGKINVRLRRYSMADMLLQGQIAGLAVAKEAAPLALDRVEYSTAETSDEAENKSSNALGAADVTPDVKVRENFAETAFFAPALRSDENGSLVLAFTTPETLTRWNVKILAHTKAMNIIEVDTAATVYKEFTIQPNMPRFLRSGDKATLTATVKSLIGKKLSGKAVMTIQNAADLTTLSRETASFSVNPNGETTVSFPLQISEDLSSPLLICKVVADCGTFSDGEAHYLPIISNKVEVVTPIPFTLSGSGFHTINFGDTLTGSGKSATDRRITIEYTANPTWLAIQALPKIHTPRWEDALTIASAFYASSLEHKIATDNPEIKSVIERMATFQDSDTLLSNALARNPELKNTLLRETPWLSDAKEFQSRRSSLVEAFNTTQASMRERNLAERLSRLQNPDGGFSWFSGMHSSFFITTSVASMLSKLNAIAPTANCTSILRKAVRYLNSEVARQIDNMKELEKDGIKPTIYPSLIEYLNILRQNPDKVSSVSDKNKSFLISLLEKQHARLDMETKATAALVLHHYGKKQQAQLAMKSIMEHTVTDKDKGIFFDSFRAPTFWTSYKIPVQVAALEAVSHIQPNDRATINGMLTWIIQSKRTQGWYTTLNTVDAVYALLRESRGQGAPTHIATTAPQSITLNLKNGKKFSALHNAATADSEATGYLRSQFSVSDLKSEPVFINVSKTDSGISWGAVYGSYLAPASEVDESGKELTLKREYFIVENGKERQLNGKQTLRPGDLVRVRYTLNAQRDYDYVSVTDPRPACLEPVKQTSGYTWLDGEGVYLAVRDASQGYFIEKLSKGRHIFSCDFRVDRAGSYLAAPASAQCLYAPEFAGHTKAFTINASN